MSVFAIADTHLSFGTDKPMDSFPGWNDYVARLELSWKKIVTEKDTVVIAGDISWAMSFDELYNDFAFLNSLPGKKIIGKGNHDYWWNTLSKMNKFIEENGFNTISFLFNNSYTADGISICGSRGWMFENPDEHDETVLARELGRIKRSLDSAQAGETAVFLHYPPVTTVTQCDEILTLLKDYNVKRCYYGHLHGAAAKTAFEGELDGIDFRLISGDRLSFVPLLIKK
ncbi:MAG: metallophosphoesterase [Eubacterium sp.]|nr:metallophosphoesterase [Eubacterium sp.]